MATKVNIKGITEIDFASSVVATVSKGVATLDLSALTAWSALGNAAADLTLANAGFNTTFNQTSAAAWLWANITTATSGTTNASPLLELAANYWTGAASAQDLWTISSSLAAGTNGASWLTINRNTFSGSSGQTLVAVPMFGVFTRDGFGAIDPTRSNFGFTFQRNTGTGFLDILNNQSAGTYGINVNGPGKFSGSVMVGAATLMSNPLGNSSLPLQLGTVASPSTPTITPQLWIQNGSACITLDAGSGAYFEISRNSGTGYLNFTGTQAGFSGYSFSSGNVTNILYLNTLGAVCFDGTDAGISRLGAASLAIGNGAAGDFSGSLKLSTLNLQTGLTTPFTVVLTGQTSSIGATNLVATPVTTSLYAVHYYLNDTTAGTSGTVSVTITWNDGASQTFTSANVTFGVLGAYVSGMVVVKATSGAIQYSTTVTSAVGSPAYSLDLRVVPLS